MKINATILADVLAGQCEQDSAGNSLWRASQADARLPELLWHLEHFSRFAGKLENLLASVGGKTSDDDWHSPKQVLGNALKFLQNRLHNWSYSFQFPEGIKAEIYQAMEQHGNDAKEALADTKVSKLIFKELDLALHHKVPVPIIGDSRFGKTKAVSVWCEMRPGKARLVTVPESNREWDFLAAHADAFGIEYNDRTPVQQLKRAVQWVVQHSGLFICYDEAHFLTPVNYCKDTPPKRINWVRCQVIDKGVGCAFFATPQSLNQTLEKYAAKTKYNLEQWIGRLAPPVVLADYYDRDELMAVAAVHFPDFPEKLLALICSRAMQSEGYLKSMEYTARYASALAVERRHRTPTIQDVDEALGRMMTKRAQAPVLPEAQSRGQGRLKASLTSPSESILEGSGTTRPAEKFTSRRQGIVPDPDRSVPLQAERDLVPA